MEWINKLMIKKTNLLFVVMFIPFMLEINCLIPFTNPNGALVRRIILADAVFIMFYYIKAIRRYAVVTKCILAFCTLVTIFTVMKGNSLFVSLYYSVTLGGYAVLIDMALQRDPEFFLSFISKVFGTVLVLTLVFQFVSPTAFGVGIASGNNYNFWVSDNEMGYVYIPLVVAIACKDYWQNGKMTKKTAVFVVLSVLSVALAWSGTCVVGILIMAVGFLIAVFDIKWVDFKKLFIVAIILCLAILVFRVQDIFSSLIVDFLHKDLTLTGRVYAWDLALEMIRDNMFIGYGTINGGRLTIFDVWANTDSVSAHSYILEITLQGGLAGLGAFVGAYIAAGKKLQKNGATQLCIFISVALFAMIVMYITEGWVYHTFQYTILFLAYYLPEFVCEGRSEKSQIECDLV